MSDTGGLTDNLARRIQIVDTLSAAIKVSSEMCQAQQGELVQGLIDIAAGIFSEWTDALPTRDPQLQAERLAWLRATFTKVTEFCALMQQSTSSADFEAKADLLFETLNKPVTH